MRQVEEDVGRGREVVPVTVTDRAAIHTWTRSEANTIVRWNRGNMPRPTARHVRRRRRKELSRPEDGVHEQGPEVKKALRSPRYQPEICVVKRVLEKTYGEIRENGPFMIILHPTNNLITRI